LSPAAYSTITDTFPREKLTRAMAIYKAGIVAGGGLALILGGKLFEYFASSGGIALPIIGHLNAWQATFVSVGSPGIILAVLLLLTREPERKGLLKRADKPAEESLSVKEVFAYMFVEHRQLYVSLFCGCSLLAIVGYSYSSWFTELLIRNYALSRSQAGTFYGSVFMANGLIGVLSAPVMVGFFQKRGFLDSNMRVLMLVSMALLPAAVAAPLMPSYQLALLLVAFVAFFQAAYVGVAAAAVQMVTPNQLRGQATAIYIFATNMLGLAVGSSLVASITDFVFADESKLHLSLALAAGLLVPIATLLFWRGLAGFGLAIRDSEAWS
jgi:MFS family permease